MKTTRAAVKQPKNGKKRRLARLSDRLLAKIAKNQLGIPTLKRRGQDSLDFYNVSVWRIEDALREALISGVKIGVEVGMQAGKGL